MTPELLEIHSLLNPWKGSGSLPPENLAKEVELEESFDEALPVLAKSDAKVLHKQKQNSAVIKNENPTTGSETKVKIKDVGKEYRKYVSKNVPFCEVCGKMFKKLRWLERHMKKHLNKSGDATPCKECGKDFSTLNIDCHQHEANSQSMDIKSKFNLTFNCNF